VRVEGKDRTDLLMSLTGAFTTAGVVVVSASILTESGKVTDVFRVQDAEGKKVGGPAVAAEVAAGWCGRGRGCVAGAVVAGAARRGARGPVRPRTVLGTATGDSTWPQAGAARLAPARWRSA
jgi:hypothetical protein